MVSSSPPCNALDPCCEEGDHRLPAPIISHLNRDWAAVVDASLRSRASTWPCRGDSTAYPDVTTATGKRRRRRKRSSRVGVWDTWACENVGICVCVCVCVCVSERMCEPIILCVWAYLLAVRASIYSVSQWFPTSVPWGTARCAVKFGGIWKVFLTYATDPSEWMKKTLKFGPGHGFQ